METRVTGIKKAPTISDQGFFISGASTRDCNARRSRRGTPACSANLIQQPRSKKPSHFCKGF